MPLYSSQKKRHPGALDWPYWPADGLDANGMNIGNCEAVDTDTGECWYYVKDKLGGYVEEPEGQLKLYSEFRPLPIFFHPKN